MKKSLIHTAKRLLPTQVLKALQTLRHRYHGQKFLSQGSCVLTVGGIPLEIPERHPLPGLMADQPLRDQCVGVTAKFTAEKYPSATMIDIGANVGDTAAIIAESCSNPLLLVEASDFFHGYLIRNTPKLKNRVSVRKVFVADGADISGELFHWGGTAEWKESTESVAIPTEKLGALTNDDVCFVKTDTDGHDFKILLAGIGWLADQRPVIVLESQVRNTDDLELSDQLLTELHRVGYNSFMVWDDAGFHLLSTTDPNVVMDTNRYLLQSEESGAKHRIYNFDIACFHQNDTDIFHKVSDWWRSH